MPEEPQTPLTHKTSSLCDSPETPCLKHLIIQTVGSACRIAFSCIKTPQPTDSNIIHWLPTGTCHLRESRHFDPSNDEAFFLTTGIKCLLVVWRHRGNHWPGSRCGLTKQNTLSDQTTGQHFQTIIWRSNHDDIKEHPTDVLDTSLPLRLCRRGIFRNMW